MKELTCIGCPRGCTLKIERDGDGWSVTGNTCPLSLLHISEEEKAMELIMDAIRAVTVTERIGRGDVVIPNVLGLGVDVIATSSLLKHKPD